jgi:hypothetical protein
VSHFLEQYDIEIDTRKNDMFCHCVSHFIMNFHVATRKVDSNSPDKIVTIEIHILPERRLEHKYILRSKAVFVNRISITLTVDFIINVAHCMVYRALRLICHSHVIITSKHMSVSNCFRQNWGTLQNLNCLILVSN